MHQHRFLKFAALLTLGLAASPALAAGVAAGTVISNTATTDYLDDNGKPATTPSNTVTATVQQVAGVLISPDGDHTTPGQTVQVKQGTDGVLTYTITNTGNGPDSYTLTPTDPSANVTPGSAKIYEDTDGDGKFDPAKDKEITGGPTSTLPADGKETLFVVYPVAPGAPAGTQYDLAPSGVSVFDPAVKDVNNVGRLVVQADLSLTLTADNAGSTTSPGTISYPHTLTNTGNSPLTSSNVVGSVTSPETASGWTYTYGFGGATYADLPALLAASGPVPQGGKLDFTMIVSDPAGTPKGTVSVGTLNAYISTPSSASVNNLTPQASQAVVKDTTTIRQGIPNALKVQSLGTVDTSGNVTFGPDVNTNLAPKPCDVLRYTVTASNTGDSALVMSTLSDPIDVNLTVLKVAVPAGVLFKNGAAYQTAQPTYQSGSTVTVGLDSNADGTVDSKDSLAPGATYNMTIYTQVKRAGDTCPAPILP